MASEEIERRLVAILMADVAGYSRLIGIDDEGTLTQLNAHHSELIEPKIEEYRGRIVRTTGDGLLVLFVSAVDALRCAVEIQRAMAQRNAQVPSDRRIEFRMGVNVGDIVEGASIHGDGINVAARLEALAEAGGICVSSRVQEDARGSLSRLGIAFEDIGQHRLKNIHHAVHIYRVLLDNDATKVTSSLPLPTSLEVPSHGSERSAGSVQAITVLIADLEGFIGLPERLGADAVPLMAGYFELISSQVHAHGGMIAKCVGDTVVAFWNTPQHAVNACRAAVACQSALGRFTLRDVSGNTLRARIGVSSGSAVVGNVGSSAQPNLAIMGDTVNIALVLERANKQYGTKIIISAETRRLAAGQIHVRPLDGLVVPGGSTELQIYELLGLADEEWARPNWLSLYEAGLDAYRARDFDAAIDSFRTLLSIKPLDRPSQVMLERCSLLLKAQPKEGNNATVATNTPRRHLTLPDKPSIAVLPFTNMSGDPEQDYFADGMVEEIITALSRFSNLFVIARNSSFTYRGRDVDAKQVGHELGVRYLLEGSVRRAGNRIRLAGQLIDAAKGVHLWAERFDGALTDIFSLQDQMTTSVVGAIIPKMSLAEFERAKHKPTDSLDAYDYYMRGVALTYYDTKDAFSDARQHFLKAMELDPHYALAHAAAAMCFEARMRNGWMSDRLAEIEEAKKLARQATELGRDDALVLASAGFVLARVASDLDDAPAFIDKALALNANLARAWQYSGWLRIWLGEPELAIEHATRAMRLSPVDPSLCSTHTAIAFAHFFMGRYDEASSSVAAALRDRPHFQPALRLSAAIHAQAGRMEKANEAIARLRALNPGLRLSNLKAWRAPQRRPEFSSMYEEGMRKAGLPE